MKWIGLILVGYAVVRLVIWAVGDFLLPAYTRAVMSGYELPPWDEEEAMERARVRLDAAIDEETARLRVRRGPWNQEHEA